MNRAAATCALLAAGAFGVVACGQHSARAEQPQTRAVFATPAATAVPASVPGGDWTRFDYDAQRSGVGPADTGIDARDLRLLRTRVVRLDGTVDSSAIELHAITVRGRARDVAIVTTTYGKTIALDPGTGARLWEFTPADIGSYSGSSQITTATPIADPNRRYVYAASPDGMIHKLAIATGREVRSAHWPARVTSDAQREKIAAALNIDGSRVLVTTGGYIGDAPTYEGHVVSIDRTSGRVLAVWNAECSNRPYLLSPPDSCRADTTFGGSAIWGRSGAVVEPGVGRILVATGNGPFDGSTNWGDSVLELSEPGLDLLHNWTPTDQAQLNASDGDLGSTAPALLPPAGGYRLAVQSGKDARLHLLNLNALDGTRGGAGSRLGGELQDIPSPGSTGVFSAPAVWSHGGRAYVLVADDSGTAAYALHLGAHPSLGVVWSNGNAGTSPVVAGGLLYVYDEVAGGLRIYEPLRGRELAALPAARGHWNSPIVVGGRIILPTGNANDHMTSGELLIYHLPGH